MKKLAMVVAAVLAGVSAFAVDISASSVRKIRVACIGDSVTWGAAMTNQVGECYPAQLQRILGDGYEVRNFGEPGSGVYTEPKPMPQTYCPFPWSKTDRAKAAYAFKPDIVVCNLGHNDAGIYIREYIHGIDGKPETETGLFYREYVALLRAFENGKGNSPRCIIWTRLTPTRTNHRTRRPNAFVMEHDLARVAETIGAEGIDMYTPLVPYCETAHYCADGTHPEGGAQRVIAEIVAKQILKGSKNN